MQVLANALPDVPDLQIPLLHRAELTKYKPDDSSPWWRRWWFKYVHHTFIDFSFKVFGVPGITAVEPESARCPNCGAEVPGPRYSWVEDEGTFDTEEMAASVCQNGQWRVVDSPHNVRVPTASMQLRRGSVYPLSRHPDRYRTPVLEIAAVNRESVNVMNEVQKGLNRLSDILTDDKAER